MAKKMYYTEDEAATKLGTNAAGLARMIKEGKLQAFADGARKMYKADQVDALSGGSADEVVLKPCEESGISLRMADTNNPVSKEDTVITAEGISIFDEDDLEIETADPL